MMDDYFDKAECISRFKKYCSENHITFSKDPEVRAKEIDDIYDIVLADMERTYIDTKTNENDEYIYEVDVNKPVIENENLVIDNSVNEVSEIKVENINEPVITSTKENDIITPVPPVEPVIPEGIVREETVEVEEVPKVVIPVPPVEPVIPGYENNISNDELSNDEISSLKNVANTLNVGSELRDKYSGIVREDLLDRIVKYNGEDISLISYLDKLDVLNKIGANDNIYRLESGSDVTTDLSTYINEALIPTILNTDLDSIKNLDELINESGFIVEHKAKEEKKGLLGFFKKGR